MMSMLLKKMKKIRAIEECQWLSLRKCIRISSIFSRCNEYPLHCAFMTYCSKEIANRRNADGVCVSLGLDNNFPASNRIWIKGYSIHASVSASPCDLNLSPVL